MFLRSDKESVRSENQRGVSELFCEILSYIPLLVGKLKGKLDALVVSQGVRHPRRGGRRHNSIKLDNLKRIVHT